MTGVGEAALIAATIASTAATVDQGNKQRRAIKRSREAQKAEQARIEKRQADQAAAAQRNVEQAQTVKAKRGEQKKRRSTGREGTIATDSFKGNKTLLGL